MRNVTVKPATLLIALAVIGGGGLIRANAETSAPMLRNAETVDLKEFYARQAREYMLLCKSESGISFRTASQETVFEEDFSGITGGTEAEPGAEIGSYTVDGNSAWPDDITSTPGWWGIGTYAIEGAVGLCAPGVGGVMSSGPMEMYGNLHVSFRAKAREGNKEGSSQSLMVSITKGDIFNPEMASAEGYQIVNLKVEDGWQDIELTFRNPNKNTDSRLQINGMTYSPAGFVIDDIKVTRDYDFCLPPTSMSCSDFTYDGFTVSWEPGAENNSYLFWLIQEKKLSEPFEGIETFDGELPQYWSTTGTRMPDGGVDNSGALRLDNGNDLRISFGGGRLASLKLFAGGTGFDENSPALIRVSGFIGDEESELATLAVSRLAEGGEEINLGRAFSSLVYQLDEIRLVAEGFEDGQWCLIDNVTYKASPACERTTLMHGEPVTEPRIVLTELDPEHEYYVGVNGVKNDTMRSDFFGYFYVPGMPAPVAAEAKDIEKRGAYTATWQPSPKALSYTVSNYIVTTVTEDENDHVVIRDDFSKADEAVMEYINGRYFDDWTDCKGWHTDKNPDNFMTASLADAGYIGTLGLPIYVPVVSLDNGDGKYTVRFKVKAFGGELISVYSNGEVQYYDFSEVNPAGDPYSFEEHEVEMHFDNGSAAQTIIIAGTYYTVLLDWFEITQDVKAGDREMRFYGLAEVDGHDTAEYRFTGLQNGPGMAYAYNVVAHGEYMGQRFSSDPSELIVVDLNSTGVGDVKQGLENINVAGVEGGVMIDLPEVSEVTVYTVSGMVAAEINASEGRSFLSLPTGFYVIRVADRSYKVAVK